MTPWHISSHKADGWMKLWIFRGKKEGTWLMLRSIETYTFTRLFLLQLTSQTLFLPPQKRLKRRDYKQERDTRRHQRRGAINTARSSHFGLVSLNFLTSEIQIRVSSTSDQCLAESPLAVAMMRAQDAQATSTHTGTTNLRRACSLFKCIRKYGIICQLLEWMSHAFDFIQVFVSKITRCYVRTVGKVIILQYSPEPLLSDSTNRQIVWC